MTIISNEVVILTKGELEERERLSFLRGVERGKIEAYSTARGSEGHSGATESTGSAPSGVAVRPANSAQNVERRMVQLVREHLFYGDDRGDAVAPSASFIDDLGADSLDQVELVMAAEEEFGIEITDAEAEKLITVADAVRFIERHELAR